MAKPPTDIRGFGESGTLKRIIAWSVSICKLANVTVFQSFDHLVYASEHASDFYRSSCLRLFPFLFNHVSKSRIEAPNCLTQSSKLVQDSSGHDEC